MYFSRKANSSPRSVHHFKSLNTPLTNLTASDIETALEIFKLIQQYMGDLKKWISTNEKSFEIVENIKNLMIKSEHLIDETYCQLMCQCKDNPSESSRRKGFELLVALACVYTIYPPSRFLFGYIVRFLAVNAVTPGVCGSLSFFSLKLLMGIEKPVEFTKELLLGLTEQALPPGVFNSKLDEVYKIEEKYQLLCQNGLLSNEMGSYGSHSNIGRSYIALSPYLKPENIYYLLTKGTFMLLVRGSDHHLKEKEVCISPLLDSLVISSLSTWEGTKAVIPMRSFVSVSRFNPGDNDIGIITNLFIESTFILNGLNSEDTMIFIASNKIERDRWLLALRCYFDWYECSGKAIDANAIIANNNEEIGKEEIKSNFIHHISSFLQDPNDFYHNLTTGIDITMKMDNDSDKPPQVGYFLLNPTLSLMFFYPESDQQHKISIDPEEIANISVTIGDPEDSQVSSGSPWAGSNIYIEFHDGKIWCINIESYYYHQLWAYMLYCFMNWYNSITDVKLLTYSSEIIKSHFTAYISNPIIPPIEPKVMIPSFLKRLINRLNELQAGTYEGIFRISGSKSIVETQNKNLNKGYYESMKLCENAHVIAVILKQWLRDMTEPIIPDSQLERMISVVKNNTKALDFIQSLPKHNCDCLIYIMIYFKELLQWSSVTKMGRDAISVVLSPNIIKSDRRVDNNILDYAKSFIEKVIDEIELPI